MSDDEKVKVVDIKPLPPTKLVKVICSTCDYPMVSRSDAAFQAAREDHLVWKHRPRVTVVEGLLSAPPLELVENNDDES
jgi:hypothetical protein